MNYSTSTENQTAHKITKTRPIRILHVVGGMHRGGIETWLMHVLRNVDRNLFQIDFLVHTLESCEYDEEIRSLGCRIIASPYRPHPNRHVWTYPAFFRQILQQCGPYDVVHSHCGLVNGNVLRLAKQAGVRIRIAHSHNDGSHIRAKEPWKRRLYYALLQFWVSRYATVGLACSRRAAVDMFGSLWKKDRRWQILYCGLDLTTFQEKVEPNRVRVELGIPQDALVIGHVGRFESQKNHQFLVEIVAEVARKEPKFRLLLVGTGSLGLEIEDKVAQLGLSDKVIFAGTRSDVPRLMLGAMDVFLFPSIKEGLGLVLIEAQAAGLPCVFSDIVPEEADVVKPLINRLSLSQSASQWAEVLLAQRKKANSAIEQSEALSILEHDSPFSINVCAKNLTDIYSEQFYHTKTP